MTSDDDSNLEVGRDVQKGDEYEYGNPSLAGEP